MKIETYRTSENTETTKISDLTSEQQDKIKQLFNKKSNLTNKEIIEWTLQKVLEEGNNLVDEFYYNRNNCLDRLEKELKEDNF